MVEELMGQATSLFSDAMRRTIDSGEFFATLWKQDMATLVSAVYDCTSDGDRHSEMREIILDAVVYALQTHGIEALEKARKKWPELTNDIVERQFGETRRRKVNRFTQAAMGADASATADVARIYKPLYSPSTMLQSRQVDLRAMGRATRNRMTFERLQRGHS